jgi:hypothetical protein
MRLAENYRAETCWPYALFGLRGRVPHASVVESQGAREPLNDFGKPGLRVEAMHQRKESEDISATLIGIVVPGTLCRIDS